MTYLLFRGVVRANDRLFRYSDRSGGDAQRWDPELGKWVDLGWPSMVADEINRGSYGMQHVTEAEAAKITGG